MVSHKPLWLKDGQALTDGGFPLQIRAMADLFDRTVLFAMASRGPSPGGTTPVEHPRLELEVVPEPAGRGLGRRLGLLAWLVRNLRRLARAIDESDLVFPLVPGDIGFLGLLLARFKGKPIAVRHCGTWGNRSTIADRVLMWWLPRLARGGHVVFATGGGEAPPAPESPGVRWIFSTALAEGDLASAPVAKPWKPGETLRLVQVGRLTEGKNQAASILALGRLPEHLEARLLLVGDGPARGELETLVQRQGLGDRVCFAGNLGRNEVLAALAGSHAFLFPTRVAEGFPKAVLEALACGLPVLASPVSVIPHLLAEGGGRVLAGTEPEDVSAAVVELVGSPNELASMGAAGRRTAARYTLEAWRDEIGRALASRFGTLRGGTVGESA